EAFEKSKEYDRKFIQKITDEMKKYAKSVCEIRNGYDAFEDEDRLKLKAKTINSLMLDIKNSFKGKNNKKILLENKEKLTPDEWKKEKLRSLVEKLSSRTEKNNELKNYYSKAFKGYDRSEDVRKYNSLTSFKPNK
ncbi:MAG: hypothetical protein GY793_07415, partial [Proteobacteria bacterium]|nr:hypothetical protein [Pseudomonadota bacterium]